MLHIVVHTPCVHVYELANHLAGSIEPTALRLPVQDTTTRRDLLEKAPEVGQVVSFEVQLADGTMALRGKGRMQSAVLGRRGVELELTRYYLEGPGAPLFWELERQNREDRGSRPSIPPIWGDETVPSDESMNTSDVFDRSGTVILDPVTPF